MPKTFLLLFLVNIVLHHVTNYVIFKFSCTQAISISHVCILTKVIFAVNLAMAQQTDMRVLHAVDEPCN